MADNEAALIAQINIQGLNEAIAQLQRLGDVGAASFEKIGEAAQGLNEHLEGAGEAINKVGEHANKAGEHAEKSGHKIIEFGEKGKSAFEGLSKSSEHLVGSLNSLSATAAIGTFEGLSSVLESVANNFGIVGKGVALFAGSFTAAVAGTGALTYGIYELVHSTSEGIIGLSNLSKEAGVTFEELVGLKSAFTNSGVSAESFSRVMRLSAVRIQAEWPDVARAVRDASDQIVSDQIKVREATVALEGAEDKKRETYLNVASASISAEAAQSKITSSTIAAKEAALRLAEAQEKVKNATLTRQSAQLSVDQAEYNLQVAYGGARDKDIETSLRQQSAEIALAEAKKRLSDVSRQRERDQLAEQKAAIDYQNAIREQEAAVIAAEKAEIELNNAKRAAKLADDQATAARLAARAAERKEQDDRLKNPVLIEKTLKGTADETEKVNLALVKTTDIFDALIAAADKSEGGHTVTNVMLEMAEAFQKMGNSAEANNQKLALIKQVGLRGADTELQSFVNVLNQGRENLEKALEGGRTNKAALQLKEQIEAAEEFEKAVSKLSGTLSTTKSLIGSTFFEAFNHGLGEVNKFVKENQQNIVDWVKDLSGVRRVIEDVFKVLSGQDPTKGGFVEVLANTGKAFADGLALAYTTLQKIADLIDKISNSSLVRLLVGDINPRGQNFEGPLRSPLLAGTKADPLPVPQDDRGTDKATGLSPEDFTFAIQRGLKAGVAAVPAVGGVQPADRSKFEEAATEAAKAAIVKPKETREEGHGAKTEAAPSEESAHSLTASTPGPSIVPAGAGWRNLDTGRFYRPTFENQPEDIPGSGAGTGSLGSQIIQATRPLGGLALVLEGLRNLISKSFEAQEKSGLFSGASGNPDEDRLKLAEQKADLVEIEAKLAKAPRVPEGGIDPDQALRRQADLLRTSIENLAGDIDRQEKQIAATRLADTIDQIATKVEESGKGIGSAISSIGSFLKEALGSVGGLFGAEATDTGLREGSQRGFGAAVSSSKEQVAATKQETAASKQEAAAEKQIKAADRQSSSSGGPADREKEGKSEKGVVTTESGFQYTQAKGGLPIAYSGTAAETQSFIEAKQARQRGTHTFAIRYAPGQEPEGGVSSASPGGPKVVYAPGQEPTKEAAAKLENAATKQVEAADKQIKTTDATEGKQPQKTTGSISISASGPVAITASGSIKVSGGAGGGGSRDVTEASSDDGSAAPGFSSGGHVRGSGSDTSDNININVSPGEYVMRAAAVRHFGLPIMEGMNRINLKERSFALGGLVEAALPTLGYAEGGAVRSPGLTSQAQHVLDLRTDHGTFKAYVSDGTMRELTRSAINAKLSRAGDKPSWYTR